MPYGESFKHGGTALRPAADVGTHDVNGARALLASTGLPACLIGDTAYDGDHFHHFLTTQGCKPNWRAIATRYPIRKRAGNFLAGLCLAVTLTFWIR
jgi:hypothetical protein